MDGHVYLIGNGANGLVKIGYSQDAIGRIATIQAMSPVRLTLLWRAEGGRALEAALHEYFKDRRVHGEWFDFSGQDATACVKAAVAAIEAMQAKTSARYGTRALVDICPGNAGIEELSTAVAVSDPTHRAAALTALINERQGRIREASRLRHEAVEEAVAAGIPAGEVAEALGLSQGRISQMLGPR